MSSEYSTELAGYARPDMVRPANGTRALNMKRLFRERGLLMAVVFFGFAIPLSAAVWFLVPAEYQASTIIRILSKAPTVLNDDSAMRGREYDTFVETQVMLIQGPTIMSKVVSDPAVRDLPWVSKERDPLHFLMKTVRVSWERGTELITISCNSPSREAALAIVSSTAAIYSKYATNEAVEGVGKIRATLVDERDSLAGRIEIQRKKITDYKRQNSITADGSTPTGQIGLEYYHDRLGQAQADYSTAQTTIANLNDIGSQLDALLKTHETTPSQPVYEMGIEDKVLADASVAMLRQQETALATRIADLKDRYIGQAPPLKAEEDRLATIQTQLEETKARVRGEALTTSFEQNRLELAEQEKRSEDAKSRMDQFQATIQSHEDRLTKLAQDMATITEDEAELEQLRANFDDVRERIRVLDVNERAPATVTEPTPTTSPEEPLNDRRKKILVLALVAAMAAGVGSGVLREMTDQGIRTPQDFGVFTDVPVIAAIPHISADKLPKDANPALVTAEYPSSTTSDEYRRIITRIIYPPEGSAEFNTVLVVGASRGDGKTTMACNLGLALAHANRRVLVVDISARRSGVEKCFGLQPARGLAEIFLGQCSPDQAVRPTAYSNLMVLGPGLEADEVANKLASRVMVEFLEDAEEAFEHVIIDTPPSLLMADAKLLAPIVDGVIVVVGSGVSSVGMVRRCLNELRQVGGNIIGVALNGARPTRGGYMRDNVSKYYSYSSEAGHEEVAPKRRHAPAAPAAHPKESEGEPPSILLLDDQSD